ncbi:helix-turn-helix domain-containing protein [Amycolatopsis sp. H20-H5]|uniref:helix-turn-helix domain-containing protein n=1 Tax=Amycolatopsis sp. H20-H5 TaxID=3046309 RepID=UPI002DBB7F98|nr:hypothetical protein [Amycolatopsis sp. H20-H5]MEC3974883.1 hypothetical protein [Amycolatopsis sp. H20-H5]
MSVPSQSNAARRRALAGRLKTAYEAGETTYSLAAEHGMPVNTVWRLLKATDTTMRPTGPKPYRNGH